jgi:hypothetical protein
LFLIPGVSVNTACGGTSGATDGGTLKSATGLVSDDASCGCAEKSPGDGSSLGIWPDRSCAVGKSDCRDGTD